MWFLWGGIRSVVQSQKYNNNNKKKKIVNCFSVEDGRLWEQQTNSWYEWQRKKIVIHDILMDTNNRFEPEATLAKWNAYES